MRWLLALLLAVTPAHAWIQCAVVGNPVKVLSWNHEAPETVEGYNIYSREVGATFWDLAAHLPVEEGGVHRGLHVPVPYLRHHTYEPFRLTEFYVTAYNEAGESDPSNIVTDCPPIVWRVGLEPYP